MRKVTFRSGSKSSFKNIPSSEERNNDNSKISPNKYMKNLLKNSRHKTDFQGNDLNFQLSNGK